MLPIAAGKEVGDMSVFPENDIAVAHDYVPVRASGSQSDVMVQARAAVSASLKGVGIQSHHPRNLRELVENRGALNRAAARGRVLNVEFLENTGKVLDALDKVYLHMLGHAFNDAGTSLENVPRVDPNVAKLKVGTIREALARDPLSYVEWEIKDLAPGEPDDTMTRHRLNGYEGPALDAGTLFELVYGGPERDFRLGLLSGEIDHGRGELRRALATYQSMLSSAPNMSPRRKFLAIKTAGVFLSMGDSIFRRAPRSESPDPQVITNYEAAIRVISENAVSDENPMASEIINYAKQQRAKLDSGLNYLGLSDSLVPIETWPFLTNRAQEHLAVATTAAHNYEIYLSRANHLEDVEFELEHELKTATKRLDIAGQRIRQAEIRISAVNESIQALSDRRDFLTAEVIHTGASTYLSAALGTGMFSGGGTAFAMGVVGLSSSVISHLSRANEIDHQMASAHIQRRLAESEKSIELLERGIIELRHEFLNDRLQTTQGRDLNKDLYYKLAGYFAYLTESQYNIALVFTFLAERAVAFHFRKPQLRVLPDFQYESTAAGILTGVARLDAIIEELRSEAVSSTKVDSFVLDISILQSYPFEYARFQQTGILQFEVSLYDLDQGHDVDSGRAGTYDLRIVDFAVQPVALGPATGYSGTLTHPGNFLSRDLASTLAPTTDRFIPTSSRFAEVISSSPVGAASGVAIDGVIPYLLDPDIKQLSTETEEFAASGPTDPNVVKLFERYGPATLWTIAFGGLDPRNILDVRFKLRIEHPETDVTLRRRVKDLLRAYEIEMILSSGLDTATDRITFVSLRTQFPDAFARLPDGNATFNVESSHFPFGLLDIRLKSFIFQVLDPQKKGTADVVVRVAKEDMTFSVERTSGIDGFSDDVSEALPVLAKPDRIPVLGTWKVELPRPEQFHEVFSTQQGEGDLLLFFLYEYVRSEDN